VQRHSYADAVGTHVQTAASGEKNDSPQQETLSRVAGLAIRDKKVYVLGTPEVATAGVRIYLDLEGQPEEGFIYLIGMTVCEGERETHQSFWADGKGQEAEIFEQFLEAFSRYDTPLILCWGSYERTFIKRMRRHARRKKPVDRVLGSLVNVLSIIVSKDERRPS
jgi:predicted RecB family nuclease